MKFGLYVCVLFSWLVAARGGVLWWGETPQADEPQTDEDGGMEVLRMVEALSRDLQDVAGQEDVWLNRYQEVAQGMEGNDELITELLGISRMEMSIIWNAYMGNMMMDVTKMIENGGVGTPLFNHSTTGSLLPPPPKFLFVYPSELTADMMFQVQAVVRTTAEANVGFCLYYAPEEGDQLDFDTGDILVGVHMRWHFDYGNSREIVLNERYNGVWSRPEVVVMSGDTWPDFQVGEKFLIAVSKLGPCFQTLVFLGRDMHVNKPFTGPQATIYCPKNPRTGDPRKLWLAVNEDKLGANEVIVHWLTWFPYK